jgi:vacuolar-type H+-ATPase subunit F/Vma7
VLKISLTATGLFEKASFTAWSRQKQAAIRRAVADGFREGSKAVTEAVRGRMRAAFVVRKASFVKSMRAKVYDRNKDKFPALLIGSKIPWLGIHVRGGTISGKMLIPLVEEGKRLGRKAFRRVIDGLLRTGNAFFIQRDGKAVLMAENIAENQSELRRFKRAERLRTGVKSIKRGQAVPVAVLVPSVTLRRRFDLEGAVRSQVSVLARAIEKQLNKIWEK